MQTSNETEKEPLSVEVHHDFGGVLFYFQLHGKWADGPEAHFTFNRNLTSPRQFFPKYGPDVIEVEIGPHGVMAGKNNHDHVIVYGQCGGGGPGGGG